MEPSHVPASSPRVYMPITYPDSPSPTYALLQLVGSADPCATNPHRAMAVARTSPSSIWLSRAATVTGAESPKPLPGGAMEASKADMAEAEAEGDINSITQEDNTESCSAGNHSPQGSSTGKSLCFGNPSPRDSCMDSGACRGIDKKALCMSPSLMKKAGSGGLNAGSTGVKKSSKVGSVGVAISVSHTEKEIVVHTDSSNFREVVHQLTGASGNEDDLLPVTLPSRSRGNMDDTYGCLSKHDAASRGPDLGPRRSMPTKLFERRRSSKTIGRISTGCRDLPPLVPSPVTPLASDFERICLPVTPLASPASGHQERTNGQTPLTSTLHQNGCVHLCSSQNQPAMYMHSNMTASHSFVGSPDPALTSLQYGIHTSCGSQQGTSVEDFVIAEKGFFLHPQRPRRSEPALLSLFPESPRDL